MVEQKLSQTTLLNSVFTSLSDPTRRDILLRVSRNELSITELAQPYNMSFAAVAKHVAVLEAAKLVKKKQSGKQQIVTVVPKTLTIAHTHLDRYQKVWNERFTTLDKLLQTIK